MSSTIMGNMMMNPQMQIPPLMQMNGYKLQINAQNNDNNNNILPNQSIYNPTTPNKNISLPNYNMIIDDTINNIPIASSSKLYKTYTDNNKDESFINTLKIESLDPKLIKIIWEYRAFGIL
jgi:hypothetical protein